MNLYIFGGSIIDPGHYEGPGDILVVDGKISAIHKGESDAATREGASLPYRIVDARQKIVAPGLIDMHVHLREPGFEHKETIESGCRAAVCGGFTAVCCMANTNPVNDNANLTQYILGRAAKADLARVYPAAAITRNLDGKEPCDYEELKKAGAVALSDDGRPVLDSRLMRRALEIGLELGLAVISHCEDPYLSQGTVMNEGRVAADLGVAGAPNASETIMVMRDIALSELTGAPVHIAHVSARESVRAIREAKARGVAVTAETAPHYFLLTEEAVRHHGANAKMNPPLRTELDRAAVAGGLADGTIDCIATDHAPHAPPEKSAGLVAAPNGIIGLETALGLSLSLVAEGTLTMSDLIAKMASNPARILGVPCGLRLGMPADITLIDPHHDSILDASVFRSLSCNSPFVGHKAFGRAAATIVGGRVVFE